MMPPTCSRLMAQCKTTTLEYTCQTGLNVREAFSNGRFVFQTQLNLFRFIFSEETRGPVGQLFQSSPFNPQKSDPKIQSIHHQNNQYRLAWAESKLPTASRGTASPMRSLLPPRSNPMRGQLPKTRCHREVAGRSACSAGSRMARLAPRMRRGRSGEDCTAVDVAGFVESCGAEVRAPFALA